MSRVNADAHYPFDFSQIPSTWEVDWVGTVIGNIQNGFASGAHNQSGIGITHLRPMNVNRQGRLDLTVVKSVADTESARVQRGDVLFNNTNSPELVGKTTIIDRDVSFAFSNHMTRLRPPAGISGKFVAYQFFYLWALGYFRRRCTHHVNQASISATTLAQSVPLIVAPSQEQERIVAEIEKHFTRLDAAATELQRVQVKLKHYRAGILQAACEGRLVTTEAELAQSEGREYESADQLLKRILKARREKWEADQLAKMEAAGKPPQDNKWKDKYVEPAAPDTSDLLAFPEGWKLVTVEQLVTKVQYGTSARTNENSNGIPVLRMGNIQDGKLVFDQLKYLPKDHEEFPALFLEPGDVLFNRTNSAELVGKTALYLGSSTPCSFASYLIRVHLANDYVPSLFVYFLNSVLGRNWIKTVATQVAGQANVNGSKLQALTLPLQPLAEQYRIVAEVERRFSILDELEKNIEISLKRAKVLRQQVLQDAFVGKLVAQDPKDEPASVLLEKIKAEQLQRETEEQIKQKGNRKAVKKTMQKVVGERRKIIDVLREAGILKPEELFREAGFRPEEVEEFYAELKTEEKSFTQDKRTSGEVYLTAKA